MANFQIFSDGACDIGLENSKKYDVKIIPFYVSLDHEIYLKELTELSLEMFYQNITEERGYPKTSLPSVQDYIDAFLPTLKNGEDVICLTITHTLSSSSQSAMTAKLMLEEDFPNAKIHIVNSWHATGSQCLILTEMAKMKAAGKSLEEVLTYAEKAKHDARIHFFVGDLSYLEVGGRVGKLATLSGGILKIKPIIILNGGEINVGGVTRSRQKALDKILDITKKHFKETGENPADYITTIGTTTIWDDIPAFEAKVKEAFPEMEFVAPLQIGATIASHTGPGTSGICFTKKYQAYSI